MIEDQSSKRSGFAPRDLWIMLVAILLVSFAPTTQSFWIDEGTMGLVSRIGTFTELHSIMGRMNGSEALMPMATAYFWAWEKIVGENEWALRCGNLPWLWLGIVCLGCVGKRIAWPWLPLLFAIHPVVWFYADEFRPYAIQLGTGSWLALAFVQILQSEGKTYVGLWNLGLASVGTIGASLLGVFVVVAVVILLAIVATIQRWRLNYRQYGILGFFALVNLLLLLELISHLLAGASGSKVWKVGLSNLGFAAYELLGFVGLGPGREALRSTASLGGMSGAVSLLTPMLPGLAALALAYAALFYFFARVARDPRAKPFSRLAFLAGAVPFLTIACLFGAALDSKFPFWGRQLAPTLPFLLLALGAMAGALGQIWPARKTAFLLIPFFAVLLLSSLEIRLNSRHSKDDYRTAVAIAREGLSQGKQICWVAALGPAAYYHLPLSHTWPPAPGSVSLTLPPHEPGVTIDLIIVSKPEIFDQQKHLGEWINLPGEQATAVCPSFIVYQFPAGSMDVR